MSLTGPQKDAIAARGNVLVVAGAGTGKTTTMVERCLDCLVNQSPAASLDEILMVTFTESAATEMRQRIRARLVQESEQHTSETRWQEQLALFETAHIGTLHSFCFQLVRQHFYELELDPQVSVLSEEEARLQADEVLEELLQRCYAGRNDNAAAVQQLIQSQARGWDEPIRRLVFRLHHYTQTLPNPSGWIEKQLAIFAEQRPALWQEWRLKAVDDWCEEWLPTICELTCTNEIAANSAPLLKLLQSAALEPERARLLEALVAGRQYPHGKKALWFDPLEKFLAEAAFLASISATGEMEPLEEDWAWVRSHMGTVLKIAREFAENFTDTKRELGLLDFHDLEQYALRLLWNDRADTPTLLAKEWQQKLKFVFVDEYQDINAAQDKILQSLSRHGTAGNRFLVGDIKQSIYRFRQANPYIFRGYLETWTKGPGCALPLVENFRSREPLLNFVNSFFSQIMHPELGGVAYDQETELRFGGPVERRSLSVAASSAPCVELHLRTKPNGESSDSEEASTGIIAEIAELEEAEKEARLVGLCLLELRSQKHPVWDEVVKDFRPVEWRDIAILLRAPANKSESYAKAFGRLKIPLQVVRRGFYRSLEISDLLSLLQILDNPLQDLPVLAVLHSPLVGLTLNELATIRLLLPKGHFWNAVLRCAKKDESSLGVQGSIPQQGSPSRQKAQLKEHATRNTQQLLPLLETEDLDLSSALQSKLSRFLDRYSRWRRLVRQVSLSRCLETLLTETHYAEWLLIQPNGEQRHANVRRLVALAERFDQFQRQGLFRFLRFVESQQAAETEPEVPAINQQDAVRLMSIHQSKGLEFPVVVLADLGKAFNRSDLNADIILDEKYGLCPQIKPPHTGRHYPSLPYWLARRRQNHELLGEELRLLYVGMTRAKDTLIMSASISESRLRNIWCQKQEVNLQLLKGAQSYADWIGFWVARNDTGDLAKGDEGQIAWLRWFRHDDSSLCREPVPPTTAKASDPTKVDMDLAAWEKLEQRVGWQYPWNAATLQAAKTSVSLLRRRAAFADEDSSSLPWSKVSARHFARARPLSGLRKENTKLSAAQIGDVHHSFIQWVMIERTGSIACLEREAQRLQDEGALTTAEASTLDFQAIAAFWDSELGRKVRVHAGFVQRELAFTVRFSPQELARFTGDPLDSHLEHELVVVQGIVDLAVILHNEIWLIDFKTDEMQPADLPEKIKLYQTQLWLYAAALSRTFCRPVSESWLYFLAVRKAVSLNLPVI